MRGTINNCTVNQRSFQRIPPPDANRTTLEGRRCLPINQRRPNATTSSMELVLVVGAGASCELGLPSGAQLKDHIVESVGNSLQYALGYREGGDVISDAFRILSEAPLNRQEVQLVNAAECIRDGLPLAVSIDNYLDAHRGNDDMITCGKLAIARCILQAEARSTLMRPVHEFPRRLDISNLQESWLYPFFQILTENCSVNDLPNRLSRVAVICFNYDRCIEQFLYHALQTYYKIDEQKAKRLLDDLTIIHPYGSTGKLPWEEGGQKCAFGSEPEARTLLSIAGQINTFTEGTDLANSRISEVRSLLGTALRVVFLGFGFHRLNLELLYSGASAYRERESCSVFATTYSMSQSNSLDIVEALSRLSGLQVSRETFRRDLKCRDLLEEYRRKLSFS